MAQVQKTVLVKNSRKRFKTLFPQIRDQMEFYFSDANLSKDRFLKQKVQEAVDGYLDLELFLKFNKIRALVVDVETLARAIKKSDFLQTNEEKTKVRRTTAISTPTDVDERTVYVECLPLRANQEWLKNVFSSCGRVAYVSLPRYKSTGDIKGFAFVEFDSVAAAQKACEVMNNPPVSVTGKPGKFPKHKEERRLERQLEFRLGGNVRKRRASESQVDETVPDNQPASKRRRTVSECRDTKQRNANKLKFDTKKEQEQDEGNKSLNREDVTGSGSSSDSSNKDIVSPKIKAELKQRRKEKRSIEDCEGDEMSTRNKRRKSDLEVSFADNAQSCEVKRTPDKDETRGHDDGKDHGCDKNNLSGRAKKDVSGQVKQDLGVSLSMVAAKKKNKKKSKDKSKSKDIPELRVISKQDWIKLRAEYLSLQKTNMTELKKSIQALKASKKSETKQRGSDASKKVICQAFDNPASKASNETTLVFTPGVIVRISSELALNRIELKSQLSIIGRVAYIDLINGDTQAHVRCDDASSASSIVAASLPGYTFHLLTGDAEKEYWDKAAADRERKLGSVGSKLKRRGRDKILQQAERLQSSNDNERKKHIVFDD